MTKDKNALSVKIEASAKLEAKTEIPPDASGRAVHAVLDVLSPFTEGMGIVGSNLRLHREKVLLKIAMLARERLEEDGKHANPVPPKFLIPFAEKASWEDPEDDLVSAWANLLVAASDQYDSLFLTFREILSELGANELGCLQDLILPHLDNGFDPSNLDFRDTVKTPVASIISQMELYWPQFQSVWRGLHSIQFEVPARILSMSIPFLIDLEDIDLSDCNSSVCEEAKQYMAFQVLERHSLVEFFEHKFFSDEDSERDHPVTVKFAQATHLAIWFVGTCNRIPVLRKSKSQQLDPPNTPG